jgi:hypothetical protein
MRELRSVSQRPWSVLPIRFMRDVLASALATGIATIAFSHLTRETAAVQPVAVTPAGKVAERLDWNGGDAPDPSLRIAETVAMFSLPQADARTWSERSVQPVQQTEAPAPKAAPAKSGMPRIAEYEAKEQRRIALPPSRPVTLAAADAPAASPASVKPEPRPAKEPIRVLGWSVPGTDLLPSDKDAADTVASVGGKVASVGKAAGTLTGKVASLPWTLAETVGWR